MANYHCKCKACKKDLCTNSAYKVIINGKSNYYCSEEEYISLIRKKNSEKEDKKQLFDKIDEILNTPGNSILYKLINELNQKYSCKLMYCYLNDNQEYLSRTMNKNFISTYAKIKYFIAILQNNIIDYEIQEDTVYERDYEILETKYKQKQKRRSLSEIENEVIS